VNPKSVRASADGADGNEARYDPDGTSERVSQAMEDETPPPEEGAPEPEPQPELLPDSTTRRTRRRQNASRQIIEWAVLIVAAFGIAVIIKTFLFQPFYIPSQSMEPTLHVNDRIFVNKLSYKMHDVHRGDIVVFTTPPGEDNSTVKDYVKRVIALPGETVEGKGGAVYINGRKLDEPYVNPQCGDALGGGPFAKRTIPAGYIWVMGDNRCNSSDSRVFGPIKESSVVGRAFVRIWPITRLSLLTIIPR
jgi:signal peptidase I